MDPVYVIGKTKIKRNEFAPKGVSNRPYTIEEIKERIIDQPFTLVSTIYVNARTKLTWNCMKCGNNWEANWHNISFGKGCRNCRHLKIQEVNNRKRPTHEKVKEFLKNKQITLLSTEYINAHTKMEVQCDQCELVWKNDFHHFKGQDSGCPKCSIPRGENHPRYKGGTVVGYPTALWTDELKETIRNRDNRKCQYPECEYTDIGKSKRLHVHHINGDKKNCEEYNLISLCHPHHMKVETNSPRDWDEYFYNITSDYEVRAI